MNSLATGLLAAAVGGVALAGENLFPRGDYTNARKNLSGDGGANGGRVSLFTEPYTWNRCGRLEITGAQTNRQGEVSHYACAMIGGDGKELGLAVKGDTLYDFSLEVRGGVKNCGVEFMNWEKGVWTDAVTGKTSLHGVALTESWTRVTGTFRTLPGKTHAVLTLKLWCQVPKDGRPPAYGIGDCLYFDNVSISEAVDDAKLLLGNGPAERPPVERRKATKGGEKFGDFVRIRKGGALTARTEAAVVADEKGVTVVLDCDEPLEFCPGKADSVWTGDSFEVFFGPLPGVTDRLFTQAAWNGAGAKYVQVGRGHSPELAAKLKTVTRRTAKGFRTRVTVPYAVLGVTARPADGTTMTINVCRTRAKAKEDGCWGPCREGFIETDRFGTFVFGDWTDALKRQWNVPDAVTTREGYELAVQKAETAKRDAKYNRLKGHPFTVAPVNAISDYACPFTPPEAFDPPERIEVRAAVNEQVGVPVAVLNLTDRSEDYIVRLETRTGLGDKGATEMENGAFGLQGLESSRITVRKALRQKDTPKAPTTLRLDALPGVDETQSISVPPKEAGLVWLDFDLADAKPGRYEGRLRVIPLSQPSDYAKGRKFRSEVRDVPFALVVDPFALAKEFAHKGGFFQAAQNAEQMRLMAGLGATDFNCSPWSVGVSWNQEKKCVEPFAANADRTKRVDFLRRQVEMAHAAGVRHPTFFVCFSCYETCQYEYGWQANTNRHLKAKYVPLAEMLPRWRAWVRGVKSIMNEAGIPDADYMLETYDEPDPARFDELRQVHAAAKEVAPGVRLCLTLGARIMSAADMRRLDPITDAWVLWRHGYFSDPGHLAYIREAMAAGKPVWHYTCDTSPRTPLYKNLRLHAWFAELHHLTGGNQFYWFQDRRGHAYGDYDFMHVSEAGLVYRSFDRYLPTLRYMCLREGLTDVRYVDALRRRAAADPATAADPEVKDFLAHAAERVMVRDIHDHGAAHKARECARELILKHVGRKRPSAH